MARFRRNPAAPRGPAQHDIRDQIIATAVQQIRDYGYEKMIIAEVASELGFSKAYIYKFFASKQEIGEVIAADTIDAIVKTAQADIRDARSACDKLRRLFRSITRSSLDLIDDDRHLYGIIALAIVESWACRHLLDTRIKEHLHPIILEGRESGEFEHKTPVDETCRAIAAALRAHTHPLMLAEYPEGAAEAADEVIGLVLRGLSDG